MAAHLILRVRLEVLADLRLGQRPVAVLVGPLEDGPREVDGVFAACPTHGAEGRGTHLGGGQGAGRRTVRRGRVDET